MKHIPIPMQLLILMLFGATVALSESEEKIPLSEVPKEIITAAQEAIPGIELTEAEVEKTDKGLVYELEGTLDGKEFEIEISANGEVLEIESDDEEETDDGDNGEEDSDDEEDVEDQE
ncbi:MAG: PepSY domain-containing protein [Candidatus Neomarinimicrobiota bacterium]